MLNNKNARNYKKFDALPKIRKDNFNSIDNTLYEKNNEYDRNIVKSLNTNLSKKRLLLLPKIKDDCLSTIDSSKKLEKDLIVFKYGKKETPKKKEENIDESNLLNIPPRKLFKLFFGIKKPKPKPKRIVNIKNKKINSSSQSTKKDKTISSLNIKNDTSNPIIDNSNNIQEIKVEKEKQKKKHFIILI